MKVMHKKMGRQGTQSERNANKKRHKANRKQNKSITKSNHTTMTHTGWCLNLMPISLSALGDKAPMHMNLELIH